jgi:hypothetical protein
MPQSIGSFNGKFSIGTIFSGGASASNTTGTGSGFDFVAKTVVFVGGC